MTSKVLQAILLKIDVANLQTGALGTRDQALLLFGFVGAFRESELTALIVADLRLVDGEGVYARVRKSEDRSGRCRPGESAQAGREPGHLRPVRVRAPLPTDGRARRTRRSRPVRSPHRGEPVRATMKSS
jgi:hypothetical protein